MSLPGMKSTADFAAGEIPQNWRSNILLLSPRNDAPLYVLTSMMKSEKTDATTFNWWEEDVDLLAFTLAANVGVVAAGATDTLTIVSKATHLKPGDMLLLSATNERVRILTVVDDTHITVMRGVGSVGTQAGSTVAISVTSGGTDSPAIIYVGSAYREGAPRSVGTSFNPVLKNNITQIFRTPVEITRTAMQTTFRTGDPFANDRRRALNKHSVGIENAFWFGSRYETLEQGQPLRYTGGITSFIDPTNIIQVNGALSMEMLEAYMQKIFTYGSKTKLGFGSLTVLTLLNQLVRKNSQYMIKFGETEYGLNVTKFFTPAGTLVYMEHPLFTATPHLMNDLFVIDTDNLRYRPMQDTTYRTDIEVKGVDGKVNEFLTEAGLEVQLPKTHAWLQGITSIKPDVVSVHNF